MKNVLVTGASKGIGKAIALKFANAGCNVIACSRNMTDLELVKEENITQNNKGEIKIFAADVSDKDHRNNLYNYVNQHFNKLDILVNNAGIFLPGQIHKEEEGVFERQMNLNINSVYYLTRMFLHKMIDAKSGHIFNMCSTASIKAYVNGGSYCISKFALYGFTKVLREELKEFNIKVTAILPGSTFTASWEGTDLPVERFMRGNDVADAVFAASELSQNTVIEEIIMRPQLGDI